MPVFVEENNYVVTLHQPGTVRSLRKVTHQHIFRQAKSFFSGSQVERGIVLVFVVAREHVEINPAEQLAAIEHVINRNIRMPDLSIGHALVGNAIHLAGKVEDPLQYARVFEIRTHGLRVVSVLLDGRLVQKMVVIPNVDCGCVRFLLPSVSEQLVVIALRPSLATLP